MPVDNQLDERPPLLDWNSYGRTAFRQLVHVTFYDTFEEILNALLLADFTLIHLLEAE